MRRLICVGLLACGCINVGCANLNQTPPIETALKMVAEEVLIPTIRAGVERGVEGLQLQAGAQGINPTYVVEFEGKWVVGIEGRATIGVEGISGQMQISAVGTGPVPE